jgi:hypothetical protein
MLTFERIGTPAGDGNKPGGQEGNVNIVRAEGEKTDHG